MTTPTLIDPQTGRSRDSLGAHERIGFELGWDYAHHRLAPPPPYTFEASALRDGLHAGRALFGARTLAPTRHVRKWLQLRLHAWLRGRSVELVQVTPNYLRQIDVSHCPITRVALSSATLAASDASVDRVRNDAGYAAGNLAVMSTRANHAKGAAGFGDALRAWRRLEADAGALGGGIAEALFGAGVEGADGGAGAAAERGHGLLGLTPDQCARVAVLCSFGEPLPHSQACALPLLVLPPNRLRLFNPVQALQAFVSQQLLAPGWSARIRRFEALLPGKALRRDFNAFFIALLARVLAAGARADPLRARWAIEDAWRAPLVRQGWMRFARGLDAARCEALLERASALRLASTGLLVLREASATDGWNLATRGYLPRGEAEIDSGSGPLQQQLAW